MQTCPPHIASLGMVLAKGRGSCPRRRPVSGLKHPDRPAGPDYKRLILGARVPRVHARGKALAVADHLGDPAPHDEMLKTLRGLKIAFVRRHERLLTRAAATKCSAAK